MKSKLTNQESWDIIIKPAKGWFNIDFRDLYKFRDLITLFVKRDFVTFYKQTILGPLWYLIQPIINSLIFTIIFGKIANIPTDGSPPFLFYMAGTVCWGYFATCVQSTSNTFINNAGIFDKVYFPRLTVPIANVIIGLMQFFVQFLIFLVFYVYYISNGAEIMPNRLIFFLPLILFQMAILGLGFGVLISSLTTKYRDLTFAMTFLIQIWMYITPVVYPLSSIPEKYRILAAINPMTSVIECFRMAFFGSSSIEEIHIIISIAITFLVFILGLIMFTKIEKTFIDTV